jgi:hypothetical protein
MIGELAKLKSIFETQLKNTKHIQELAKKYSKTKNLFFL